MRLKRAAIEMIRLSRLCRVATVDRRGVPHNVPVCPAVDQGRIYFASAGNARKILNVKNHPKLALIFDDYTEEWSALRGIMIQGTAKVISHGPLFRKIRRLLYRKYFQYESEAPLEENECVVVEITPERNFSWGL